MAQPSGLSVSADGTTLWIADSESSALRFVQDGRMHTAVGQGLFDFGHVDGPAEQALLQHPLGVCALADGSVLVADTYNGAVRRYDPATGQVGTVATGLAEPSDVVVLGDGAVVVVESAAHRLTAPGARRGRGGRGERRCPPPDGAPAHAAGTGGGDLEVIFDAGAGPEAGRVVRAVHPAGGLGLTAGAAASRAPASGTDLHRRLVLAADVPKGVLQVVAQAATCDADVEHAACHLTRQDWGVPIMVTPDGAARLPLVLRGLDA